MELTNEDISLILGIVAFAIIFFEVIFSRSLNCSGIVFVFSYALSTILTFGIAATLFFVAFAFTPTYWCLLVIGVACFLTAFASCIRLSNRVGFLYENLRSAILYIQALLTDFKNQ